jgi:hypothetical protein
VTRSEQGRALVDEVNRVWNARDLMGMLQTYDEQATIVKPGHPVVQGHAQIAPWLRGRLDALGEFRARFVYRACDADFVVCEYDTVSHPPGGERTRVRGMEFFGMSPAGRITVQRQYNYVVLDGMEPWELEAS